MSNLMNNVKINVEYGVKNHNEEMKNMNPYTVTLKYNGRQLTTDFYTGSGWTREPNAKDVLHSLLLDASSYNCSSSFEDFCNELGYDSDSRKAEKIYKACEATAKKLQKFLGSDYQAFENELQDY